MGTVENRYQPLLDTLKNRFDKNMHRHRGIAWDSVLARLVAHPEKLSSLQEMEATGGEPDVTDYDGATGAIVFMDCSPESPKGRRSICYDHAALAARKEHKPKSSAVKMAEEMGVELLTEAQYQALQSLGTFDEKTSSWLKTPSEVRMRGGAIYGDCRFGRVFIYHNGAESYYAARGFRAAVTI